MSREDVMQATVGLIQPMFLFVTLAILITFVMTVTIAVLDEHADPESPEELGQTIEYATYILWGGAFLGTLPRAGFRFAQALWRNRPFGGGG